MGCTVSSEVKDLEAQFRELKRKEQETTKATQGIANASKVFKQEVTSATKSLGEEIKIHADYTKGMAQRASVNIDKMSEDLRGFKVEVSNIRYELDSIQNKVEHRSKQQSGMPTLFRSFGIFGTSQNKDYSVARDTAPKKAPNEDDLKNGLENFEFQKPAYNPRQDSFDDEPVEAAEFSTFIPVPSPTAESNYIPSPAPPAPVPPVHVSKPAPPAPQDDDIEKKKAETLFNIMEITLRNVDSNGIGMSVHLENNLTKGTAEATVTGFKEADDGSKLPAEAAGVQIGDVLLKINGKELKTQKDLFQQLQKAKGNVVLTISRPAAWSNQID